MTDESKNRAYLFQTFRIENPQLQAEAIRRLPCGIELVEEAMQDETAFQINGPRVIMIVSYKGFLSGLEFASGFIE